MVLKKTALKKHTEKYSYHCHLCEKAFSQKTILMQHVKEHNLTQHVITHTGEKSI